VTHKLLGLFGKQCYSAESCIRVPRLRSCFLFKQAVTLCFSLMRKLSHVIPILPLLAKRPTGHNLLFSTFSLHPRTKLPFSFQFIFQTFLFQTQAFHLRLLGFIRIQQIILEKMRNFFKFKREWVRVNESVIGVKMEGSSEGGTSNASNA